MKGVGLVVLGAVVGWACAPSDEDGTEMMGAEPEPIPAACEGVELPADRGQGTQVAHVSTVAAFDLPSLQSWLGVTPEPDQGILVVASHREYGCNRIVSDNELDYSQTYSSQSVYLFPGPIEARTYEIGTDLEGWNTSQLGDGMGNAGSSSGEITEGSVTFVEILSDCVTGLVTVGDNDSGFAASTLARCN